MSSPATIASTRLKIGLEIHVELATRSKMFTRTANVAHPDHFDAAPNTLVDPVVAALPGALPVLNRRAIEMSIMVGLALDCRIASFSKWDRKNYFYPDLPKGYQISQYDLPLCADGALTLPRPDGTVKRVGITRCHLEEDTGKLGHELPGGLHYDGSLVDLNRAGTPLLEIVTEPDLEDADDTVSFAKELRSICRFLGVTEGIMQRGHMRFEPNINVIIQTSDGHEYATPVVEVKNLNSFRAVKGAIDYERDRQVAAWREDGLVMGPGAKSTRGWDDTRGVTVLQREKEDAHDYRYFPDPDLVPVVVDDAWRETIAASIPELPMKRRARYVSEYGLSPADAVTLTDDPRLCDFYDTAVIATAAATPDLSGPAGLAVAKLLLNAGAKRANETDRAIHELGIGPEQVAQLIALREANEVGSTAADELFGHLCQTDEAARAVAEREGLLQVRDDDALDAWVDAAIAAQPQAADDFAAGKDAAAGRLVGEVMKRSQGKADAKAVRGKLEERLR
ncbi:MAG: Asp-tRNA(Asn)/Glu-tRNA(Gln) amidotransferase subunit GatB [Phycisphaerales bacterium]|nr:Asp-tRNA(Asn)/Glu-tRNA(Gln) amidotransferase subunit GatB [Phycisphaerae bacterium]NNF41459.1 Asp-tRNA(Asn)/Glu-tRNA(Gln) amidotransferase subunit GatB [Phycisphaerales bacterium]NNM24838.1 Asp-tRNA(Asn)/Glu-tRNA(Gln) amidotransferase subunit GatB [Phycisphaerales bacterium]